MELLPAARHMAALTDTNTYSPERLQTLQELTRQRGSSFRSIGCPSLRMIAGAIERGEKFRRARAQRDGFAVYVGSPPDHPRTSCLTIAAGHVPIPANGRGGRFDRLRHEHRPGLARDRASAGRRTVARGKSRRRSRRAAEQVRLGY